MLAVVLAVMAATGFAFSYIFARLGLKGVRPRTGAAISIVPSVLVAAIPALIVDASGFTDIPLRGFLWLALIAFIRELYTCVPNP